MNLNYTSSTLHLTLISGLLQPGFWEEAACPMTSWFSLSSLAYSSTSKHLLTTFYVADSSFLLLFFLLSLWLHFSVPPGSVCPTVGSHCFPSLREPWSPLPSPTRTLGGSKVCVDRGAGLARTPHPETEGPFLPSTICFTHSTPFIH